MHRPVCCVSVDLDRIGLYHAIHGMDAPSGRAATAVIEAALPRYLDVLGRLGLRATFFVVGEDLADPAARRVLAEAARQGHELANHSHTHPYDLGRRPRAAIAEDLRRAHDAIGDAGGRAPTGFRAPGYNLTPAMLDAVAALGYRYDSSILPTPPYQAAKALIMAAQAIAGRPSRSSLGDPRLTLAPRLPYRPDPRAPWRRGQSVLVELPMAVTPWLRVPVIGTSVLAAPPWLRERLVASVRPLGWFNFELHGIDLVGADEDAIDPALTARQPDLRVALADKARAFEATLAGLVADGYEFLTLDAAATNVQREGVA